MDDKEVHPVQTKNIFKKPLNRFGSVKVLRPPGIWLDSDNVPYSVKRDQAINNLKGIPTPVRDEALANIRES